MASSSNSAEQELLSAQIGDPICTIDPNTRKITVPSEYQTFGVSSDENVTRIPFICPMIVGDNMNLMDFDIFVNYRNASGKLNVYAVETPEVVGDNIIFSWLLSRSVTETPGTVNYIICAKQSDGQNIVAEWNTRVASATVAEGLEAIEEIAEEHPDFINQALNSIYSVMDQEIFPQLLEQYNSSLSSAEEKLLKQYDTELENALASLSKVANDSKTSSDASAASAASAQEAATASAVSAASAQESATASAASAKTAQECAQAMAGTFDFTGYLRYQIVTEAPTTYEDGVLYIVKST